LKNYNLVEFINKLEDEFPSCLAEDWDNVGLQIANENIIINNVLITLDITSDVIEYAKEKKFNLIISHHPLIFSPIYSIIAFNNYLSHLIKELLLYNIAVFVIHTNLDKIYFELLSQMFNLKNIKPIKEEINYSLKAGTGSYGELSYEITLKELLEMVKKKLNIEKLKYVGDLNKRVKIIGTCGGTGTSLINEGLTKKGIDVLITADLKYHTALNAKQLGIAVIDAGHYHTEKILLPHLRKKLINLFSDTKISFEVSNFITDPLNFY